jgi:hypothetical protein
MMNDGRTMDDGRWTMDGGQWTMGNWMDHGGFSFFVFFLSLLAMPMESAGMLGRRMLLPSRHYV